MAQPGSSGGGYGSRRPGFRGFAATRLGKLVLSAIALGTLVLSFYYLGPYFAIPTFVLFGLALPIYGGWKAPRQLAAMGIVVLLVAGPIVNYGLTAQALVPSPAATSASDSSNTSTGAPVLTNAIASPYNGASGSMFAFSVDMYPNRLPANFTPDVLWLYVSTCPGATGNSSPFCGSGYPFFPVSQNVSGVNASPTSLTFHVKLGGPNIWWWQMGLLAKKLTFNTTSNRTNATYDWIFLSPGNSYGAVQGPITGTWATTYDLLIGQSILDILFYPGIVFYLGLLAYMFWKSREARKKAQREASAAGALPPTTGAPPSSAPPPPVDLVDGATAPRREELACPKCGAVVYPGETKCWKCGADLGVTGTPLQSGGA